MPCRQRKQSTSQVVNLRRVRKQKTREAKAQDAAERRAKFGLPKAEKARQTDAQTRDGKHLDGHRLSTAPSGSTEDES